MMMPLIREDRGPLRDSARARAKKEREKQNGEEKKEQK